MEIIDDDLFINNKMFSYYIFVITIYILISDYNVLFMLIISLAGHTWSKPPQQQWKWICLFIFIADAAVLCLRGFTHFQC